VPNVQMGFSPMDGQDGLIRQPFLLRLIKGHDLWQSVQGPWSCSMLVQIKINIQCEGLHGSRI
jgi:hypothetical protein